MERESGSRPQEVKGTEGKSNAGRELVSIEGEGKERKQDIMRRLYEANQRFLNVVEDLLQCAGDMSRNINTGELFNQLRLQERIALDAADISLEEYGTFFDEINARSEMP